MDGRQHSRQGVTGDTTTNHRQECWRRSEAGGGCSDGRGGVGIGGGGGSGDGSNGYNNDDGDSG